MVRRFWCPVRPHPEWVCWLAVGEGKEGGGLDLLGTIAHLQKGEDGYEHCYELCGKGEAIDDKYQKDPVYIPFGRLISASKLA